jgi:serralysin
MCVVCEMVETLGSTSSFASSATGFACVEAEASSFTTTSVGATSTQSINGLLSGYKWAVTNLTYSFPSTTAPYGNYLNSGYDETLSFSQATALAQTSVREAMKQVSAVTGLTVTENFGNVTANIRIAESSLLPAAGGPSNAAAYAYLPSSYFKGGDVWLGPSSNYDSPFVGSIGWRSIWHEVGHALGLKHAHEFGGVASTPVPAARNSHEYTVMTYFSYVGGPGGYPNEVGGHPQSFMMDDIRALQQMYGADFTSAEAKTGNTVYRFSSTTGQMSIQETLNGATTITYELAPGVNRILRTVWDGGGIDTYDFSNYTTNMTINLQPGEWSTLSAVQLTNLGNNNYARGNLANALQFNNDARSLIENAIGGSGNDTLTGNAANNELRGGAGNDTYLAVEANDTIIENANEGTDTVQTAISFYVLGSNLENLTGTGFGQTLIGNEGNNVITGTFGNDFFNGGSGRDTLIGGFGNDLYNAVDGDITIIENSGGGIDTVQTAAASYILAANVENLVGNGSGQFLTGNLLANVITSSSGADTLAGGAGDDVYLSVNSTDSVFENANEGVDTVHTALSSYGLTAHVENLIGTGSGQSLSGNSLANSITGTTGSDTLAGGLGDDTYVAVDATDIIIEDINAGIDTIRTTVSSYTLSNNIENLTATGFAQILNGNSLANVILGTAGNDTLDGKMGDDTLIGGLGNDTYVIDTNMDGLIETVGQGIDTVRSTLSFTQLDAAGALENLTYIGTGSSILYGNSTNNVIIGGEISSSFNGFAGSDLYFGGIGDDIFYIDEFDTYNGSVGTDYVYIQTLTGTTVDLSRSQVEYVVGYIGNDNLDASNTTGGVTLIGGAGADMLKGGLGNDLLFIDADDMLVDAGGGTNDIIAIADETGVTLNITAAHAEYVIGGGGNDVLNAAGSATRVTIQGGAGADTITGGNADDYLFGGMGADIFKVTSNAQFDVIFDFVDADGAEDDKIDVRGLGVSFDTIEEILAATTDYSGTSVINFGGGNQLYLYQITKSSLTADDFIFV